MCLLSYFAICAEIFQAKRCFPWHNGGLCPVVDWKKKKKRKNDKALKREVQNKAENILTLFTLVSCVSRHTLAAKGAPLAMTATAVATGRIAHVDTAAVGGQTAWRAGLGVSWGAQIIKLNGGDRGQEMGDKRWRSSKCREDHREKNH